jgi:hypothetical protein
VGRCGEIATSLHSWNSNTAGLRLEVVKGVRLVQSKCARLPVRRAVCTVAWAAFANDLGAFAWVRCVAKRGVRGGRDIDFSRLTHCFGRGCVADRVDGRGLAQLGELVEFEEEFSELCEVVGAELLCPGGFDLADRVADDADCAFAAWRDDDALAALVVGIGRRSR